MIRPFPKRDERITLQWIYTWKPYFVKYPVYQRLLEQHKRVGNIINLFTSVKSAHIFHHYTNCWLWHWWKTERKEIWASSWDYGTYHIGGQRSLRRACASAQSRQSLRCSHTWSMEVDEGSYQKSRHLAPLDGCACVFEEWVYGGQKVS